jgi:L-iditol 2-dehydrogenase
MKAARLYGPRDIRIDNIPELPDPGPGQIVLRVLAVGVCGSDLHNYEDARIGDTVIETPVILGHEFAGVVEAVGSDAHDGLGNPLGVGQRVAVDPATPCWQCENCEAGHPNLCVRLHFHGLWPEDGALTERMICSSRGCFPLPDALSDATGALLEPLGIAIHAVDLAKLQLARSVAVIGAGPIGLLITRLARLSGADPIYAFDCYPWRAEKARDWGATAGWTPDDGDPVDMIKAVTAGRGVDVVFEAAWADESVNQAGQMARMGGKVILVGIPSEDVFSMQHSVARRRGLTIKMSRRMKHTYPRAIHLATEGQVDIDDLVSHRFPLEKTAHAFAINAAYEEGVHKIVIEAGDSTGGD